MTSLTVFMRSDERDWATRSTPVSRITHGMVHQRTWRFGMRRTYSAFMPSRPW